jgi:hypothetical protein
MTTPRSRLWVEQRPPIDPVFLFSNGELNKLIKLPPIFTIQFFNQIRTFIFIQQLKVIFWIVDIEVAIVT